MVSLGSGASLAGGSGSTARQCRPVLSALCAVAALLMVLLTVLQGPGVSAWADSSKQDADYQKQIKELSDGYLVKDGSGKADLLGSVGKALKEKDDSTFGYLLRRVFSLEYLNHAADAAQDARATNCDKGAAGAGTPYYHNCDIPNIVTEFAQAAAETAVSSGPYNAEVSSARGASLGGSSFGLPDASDLPAGGPSVIPGSRTAKYTALELYGYNLKYTSYFGEWDNIKVLTSARTLSNFGFMDNVKLGAKMVFKGIASGVRKAASDFADRLTSGQVLRAFSGIAFSFSEGGSVGAAKTVLDTSDQNVFNSYSWYRVGYGGTLYGARELTESEQAARMKRVLYQELLKTSPQSASLPADLVAIKDPPAPPRNAVSRCVIRATKDGKEYNKEVATSPDSGGTPQDVCSGAARSAASAPTSEAVPTEADVDKLGEYFWDEDGTAKAQTLQEWYDENSARFATSDTYGMGIDRSVTDNSQRDVVAGGIIAQWASAWQKAADKHLETKQYELNNTWASSFLDGGFRDAVASDPRNNVNAPWGRFVCTSPDGSDMLDASGDYVFLMSPDGTLNPQCSKVRPPVQDGFFGNGYDSGAGPQPDTRRSLMTGSLLDAVFPHRTMSLTAGVMLTVAANVTMLSNELLKWSFSPILSELGMDTLVVNVITYLRDSLFFPLVVVMVAAAGLGAVLKAAARGAYGQQLVSMMLTALTVMLGAALMFAPEGVVRTVDHLPAVVEEGVVAAVFSAGKADDTDNLCTATGTASSESVKTLTGSDSGYRIKEGTRTLMCENWRTFAFNPWVYGQWGTSYGNLYAHRSGSPGSWRNTNEDLVGDAGVYMGGGRTENNWALYQLDTTTSGTAYQDDPADPSGAVSRDFYRIVDAQAGPDGGTGRDGRFLHMWSGKVSPARVGFALVGAMVGVLGAWAVAVYSVVKIQVSFLAAVMLVIMPFMFLAGVLPGAGRSKLKAYLGGVLGLMVQRVVLVLLLAVMFKVVSGAGTISSNYVLSSLFATAVCVFFLTERKNIMNLVSGSLTSAFGQPVGQAFMDRPLGFMDSQMPAGLRTSYIGNKVQMLATGVKGVAAGAVAGAVTGNGLLNSARQAASVQMTLLGNRQRRAGFGALQSAVNAASRGSQAGAREMATDPYVQSTKEQLLRRSDAYADYQEAKELYDKLPKRKVLVKGKLEEAAYDPETNEVIMPPVPPSVRDLDARSLGLRPRRLRKLSAAVRAGDDTAGSYIDDEPQVQDTTAQKVFEHSERHSSARGRRQLGGGSRRAPVSEMLAKADTGNLLERRQGRKAQAVIDAVNKANGRNGNDMKESLARLRAAAMNLERTTVRIEDEETAFLGSLPEPEEPGAPQPPSVDISYAAVPSQGASGFSTVSAVGLQGEEQAETASRRAPWDI